MYVVNSTKLFEMKELDKSKLDNILDDDGNPIIIMFREKIEEYWSHIKNIIDYVYVKREEAFKKKFRGGLPSSVFIKPLLKEKKEIFSIIIPRVGELIEEGLSLLKHGDNNH